MGSKPRTIKLKQDIPFEEELLPTRSLLHIYFQDTYQNNFRWTPRWKDVQRIFWKALDVEEKNNPEGVWDEEFKKMAQEISAIKDYKLPVRVKYGGLQEVDDEEEEEGWRYRITISIWSDEERAQVIGYRGSGESFCIGDCQIRMSSLQRALKSVDWPVAISKECQDIVDYETNMSMGIKFWIWAGQLSERLTYQAMCREIAGAIRSYIRNVILDSKRIQKGIEEMEQGESEDESEIPF